MTQLTAAQSAKIAHTHVLVLSANRFISQLVRSLFFGLGVQDVAIAATADTAMDRCRSEVLPGLVMADTGMSTFDPKPALDLLQKESKRRQLSIPMILLASSGVSPILTGASPIVLEKPICNQKFVDVVNKAVLNIESAKNSKPDSSRTARIGKATTLLLSENPFIVEAVRASLTGMNLPDVSVAGNPEDGAAKLGRLAYDLIVADMGPSSFDGLACVEKALAAGLPNPATPVALLTSKPSPALVERARAANVKALLMKPFDSKTFADRVRKLVS